jgi:predicted kinase
MTQLVIIRGNSGSGKSTVAREVREKLPGKIALIEQDYFRRIVLKEKDSAENTDIIVLLDQTVRFAIARGYTVILEGILSSKKYGEMLRHLANKFETAVLYMDVSLEETLIRHQSKSNAHEFGDQKMREWYLERDFLGVVGEVVIPEQSSLKTTIDRIVGKLKAFE